MRSVSIIKLPLAFVVSASVLLTVPSGAVACNDSLGDTWHLECVKVTTVKRNVWRLTNVCNRKVEMVWCVRGANHAPCKPRPFWWGAQWEVAPGKYWDVPQLGGHEIEFNACHYRQWK